MSRRKLPAPPEGLSERACSIWLRVVRTRSRSVGRLALLEECLRALDRADQLRDLLATQELVVTTKSTGSQHAHPLLKAEKESRMQFAHLAKVLGLAWDVAVDGAESASRPRYWPPPWQQPAPRPPPKGTVDVTLTATEKGIKTQMRFSALSTLSRILISASMSFLGIPGAKQSVI